MGRKSRAIEDYFASVDTLMQAYILGLLAADGNVYVNKKRAEYKISLKLHQDDEMLVRRTRDELAPTVNFSYPKPHFIRFEVCSLRMANDLARFGVVPRKTWNLPWPAALPEAMAMPFLLGYFDGDGTLIAMPPRPHKGMHEPYLIWQLVGHQDFLLNVRRRLLNWCGVELVPPRLPSAKTAFLYRLSTSGEKAEAVDLALNKSGLGLRRKHIPGIWERYQARMDAEKQAGRASE
jgi:hypothetical protein